MDALSLLLKLTRSNNVYFNVDPTALFARY